jgi:hypothetical protein
MDYTKPDIHPAWAETAAGAPDIVQPTDVEIGAGWPLSPTPPSRGRFNWVLHYVANAVRYFMQRGLSDYDAAENYRTGSRIIGDDGNTYTSLVNANVGNLPSASPTKWKRWGFTMDDLTAIFAPKNSPVFIGNPTTPTVGSGDNSNTIASTAMVQSAITAATTPLAPKNSPVFTGNPTAPTPLAGDNSTSLATTAFVKTLISGLQVIKFGVYVGPSGNGIRVNFNYQFPSAPVVVATGNGGSCNVTNIDSTGFTLNTTVGSVQWIAIHA